MRLRVGVKGVCVRVRVCVCRQGACFVKLPRALRAVLSVGDYKPIRTALDAREQ